MSNTHVIPLESVGQKIFIIRGMKVMLDSDLAVLYQVRTIRLNEQVKRNKARFPPDFMFQLTEKELAEVNLSQFAIGSQKHRSRQFLPYAFTEHGVAMLAAVLKSPKAVQMSVFIVRAFIKLREVLTSNKELSYKIELLENEQGKQGVDIEEIKRKIQELTSESVPPKGPLGSQ